ITLDRMARGGVYDQVGGGFHRYAVDGQWAVPHFEKMLYDNAQLAPVYLHAWQLSGEERWRRTATDVLDYALREMRLPGGGFASSQDADSGGVEGSFFVWTPEQLREVLGDEDGGALDRADYVDAARDLAAFLLTDLVRDGVVLRTWKDGEAKITGFLEDVASLADGLLTLYEVTGEPRWYEAARRLCDGMVERYFEPTDGFYDTAIDGDPLLVRPRTLDDNAVPAGRSTAAL